MAEHADACIAGLRAAPNRCIEDVMSNRLVFPSEVGPLDHSWTDPLEMIRRALHGVPRVPSDEFFDLSDFMIMCRVVRGRRPDIVLYKHYLTRRYINVDDAGHTYRYHPPRSHSTGCYGSYRPHRDLRRAVSDLWLWELPWMKPSLEQHRRGLSWGDRWLAFDDDTGDLIPPGEPLPSRPGFEEVW